jgi:hypothetical protein
MQNLSPEGSTFFVCVLFLLPLSRFINGSHAKNTVVNEGREKEESSEQ